MATYRVKATDDAYYRPGEQAIYTRHEVTADSFVITSDGALAFVNNPGSEYERGVAAFQHWTRVEEELD